MRAGIVAIFFFAALLALGHYVAAPFFCRGELLIPTLDARALCGADMHLNRSGSVLLYFASIAGALFFGIVAGLLPGRSKKAPQEKTDTNPAATFEQIIAEEEKKQQSAPSVAVQPTVPSAQDAPATPATTTATGATAAETTPSAEKPAPEQKKEPEKKPEATVTAPAQANPATAATAEAITVGLAVTKNASRGSFDGTNAELLERFRELKKQEGVNSIAQAQRLLDESTLSALAKGIDPKQHLSDVAHLVLTEDPDLKSGVVRGVVVHIAARLKELGVANKLPNPAKGAA